MVKRVIIGYSGHSYVVLDAAKKAEMHVDAYTEKEKRLQNPFLLDYLGFEGDENFEGWNNGFEFILGIGDNLVREKVAQLIVSKKEVLRSIIHPSTIIGSHVEIGNGSFIAAGALINPLVSIGKAVIINTGAIIEHECQIGNSVHIAPGTVLAGNVKVGDRSFIGSNTAIKEGVEIGNDVVIGQGSVILNDVKSKSKVVGNPGRLL